MPVPSKILHPLLSRPGASQRKRTANAFALQSDYAPIDGRTLADMLDFIHRYAHQVVFQEYKKEEQGNGYIELSDWLRFFERSLPFQLVRFNKMNLKNLEADFLRLSNILNEEPNEENLGLLLHFLYNELLIPIQQLHTITAQYPFAFNTFLEATIRGLIASSLKQYIMLANSSKKYFCIEKPDFFAFTNTPWDLQIDDIYATDEWLTRLPGGRTAVIQWLNEQLSAIFYQILGGIRQIVLAVPDYLGQSLEILGGRHEPHVGLLFAFLSLFKYFQNDLNQLTQEHLDFFYKHVLQIRPKGLVPDKAHLVFEIGQHRNSYPIPKGTFFKDGKDARNADILFGLDEEIVIDKAKIKDLKTLYLNQVKGKIAGSASEQFVEGLYIAPKANTADGQEIAFEETQSKNWATLGAKPSKYIAPGQRLPQDHPYGRIGFVLASPVLWLNEGKRKIRITIQCEDGGNKDFLSNCFQSLPYKITADTLERIRNLFSPNVRTFLEQKLEGSTEIIIQRRAIEAFWLEGGEWTTAEKQLFACLTEVEENNETKYVLIEPPFESLIDFLKGKIDESPDGVYYITGGIDRFLMNEAAVKACALDKIKQQLESGFERSYYKISETSIKMLQNVFSNEAKIFLQERLDENTPYTIDEIGVFLDSTLPNDKQFTPKEKRVLRCITEIHEGEFALNELPFASIISYFNTLLIQQTPYCIGFDIDTFLSVTDPVSCEPLINSCLKEDIKQLLDTESSMNQWFHIQLSGEENWITPEDVTINFFPESLLFKIEAHLKDGDPAIVFYDNKKLGENLLLECPLPVAKIELNNEIKVICEKEDTAGDKCCLVKDTKSTEMAVSLYHFFRHFKIIPDATKIEVEVCGLKNIVVQNDESLQDVNGPILPFGARPKVDSDFYIGNKEVFCKNWETFRVKVEWKNKPPILPDGTLGLEAHYADYDFELYENGANKILENSFELESSLLEGGTWKTNGKKEVFLAKDNVDFCDDTDPVPDSINMYAFEREQFENSRYTFKKLNDGPLTPLSVNTRDAFIRFRLKGVSFQHDRYASVLARFMFQLTGKIDLISIDSLNQGLGDNILILDNITSKIDIVKEKINALNECIENNAISKLENPNELPGSLLNLKTILQTIKTDLEGPWDPGNYDQVISNLGEVLTKIQSLISQLDTLETHIAPLETIVGSLQDDLEESIGIPEDSESFNDFNDSVMEICNRIVELQDALNFLKSIKLEVENEGENNQRECTLAELMELLCKEDDPDTEDEDEREIKELVKQVKQNLETIKGNLQVGQLGLPKEPYTPTLKSISIDYKAKAVMIDNQHDITLIHLYPYQNTSRTENIELGPTLLPTFTDEGTLFIGLENLRPGATLQLLFQLAEATADSESFRAEVEWAYLAGNRWLPLRKGFEILSDATEGLTTSGVVRISLPRAISNQGNTIMPTFEDKPLFWLKVSAADHVESVSETIDVHAQAALANYAPMSNNDPNRVGKVVEPGKIAKPAQPDFNIKKVNQPYESFGGRLQEVEGHLYTRISEQLRHKGRSVELFDFEHLVLEAFPEIFKCKCISHTLGLSANDFRRDLEVAPGFIVLAVVPDLTKLKSGDFMEPKVSLSLLSKIKTFIQTRVSAFARIRVMNPRFEKIKVDVKVRLKKGRDIPFYTQQLKTDLQQFLAPWHLGDASKITFGQHIMYSDVLHFIEKLPYIDFISDLKLYGEEDVNNQVQIVVPRTARSVLTGGEICIEVDTEDCNDRSDSFFIDKEICLEALDEFVQTPVAFTSRFKK
ncbi:MAG: hypothetical protein R2828_05170 [Saprospiraceae bacterium]